MFDRACCRWTCLDTVMAAAIALLLVSILVAVLVASVAGNKRDRAEQVKAVEKVESGPYRSLRIAPPVSQYDAVDVPFESMQADSLAVAGSVE